MSKSDNNDQQRSKVITAPAYIPKICDFGCSHQYGILNRKCNFYKEDVERGQRCIATKRFGLQPGLNEKITLICPDCKTKQKHQDALYCINCGADLFPKTKIEVKECPTCKTRYEMSDTFCDKDGTKLAIWEMEVDDDNPNVEVVKMLRDSKNYEKFNEDYDNPNLEVKKMLPDSKDTERINENDDNVNEKQPMNWYKFVTYVMCPLGIITSLYWMFIFIDYSEDIETLLWFLNAGFLGILLYGLHNRTTWSWKLLIGAYIFNSLLRRVELLDEWGLTPYLIFLVIANLMVTYPNYIYFKKRGHLFQN